MIVNNQGLFAVKYFCCLIIEYSFFWVKSVQGTSPIDFRSNLQETTPIASSVQTPVLEAWPTTFFAATRAMEAYQTTFSTRTNLKVKPPTV